MQNYFSFEIPFGLKKVVHIFDRKKKYRNCGHQATLCIHWQNKQIIYPKWNILTPQIHDHFQERKKNETESNDSAMSISLFKVSKVWKLEFKNAYVPCLHNFWEFFFLVSSGFFFFCIDTQTAMLLCAELFSERKPKPKSNTNLFLNKYQKPTQSLAIRRNSGKIRRKMIKRGQFSEILVFSVACVRFVLLVVSLVIFVPLIFIFVYFIHLTIGKGTKKKYFWLRIFRKLHTFFH